MTKGKTCGINTFSYSRVREIVKETMDLGASRKEALSWAISDLMSYCYEDGLPFKSILKEAQTTFEWQISSECEKCKKKISPDDHSEGEGRCACCIPKAVRP